MCDDAKKEEHKRMGWAPPVYDPTFSKEIRVISRNDAYVSQLAEDAARDAVQCRFESCHRHLTEDDESDIID